MRLNLGCGNHPLKNWKNIDKYYYPGTAEMHPDWGKPEDYDWEKGDFTDLSKFEDNSIESVNICHALEHVSWEDAQKTIKEIYRILEENGAVEIEVPDLEKIFHGNFSNLEIQDLVYGGRDSNVYWGGHFCGFTIETLGKIMEGVGFRIIKETEVGFGTSKPEPDRNFRLRGVK